MENAKKTRGRPKKEEGREEFWRFVRAGMIVYAYNEARKRKQKHSAAVGEAVAYVRQHRPEMPVSETVVKRTLATFRSFRPSSASISGEYGSCQVRSFTVDWCFVYACPAIVICFPFE